MLKCTLNARRSSRAMPICKCVKSDAGRGDVGFASLMQPEWPAPGGPSLGCRYAKARTDAHGVSRLCWPGGVMHTSAFVGAELNSAGRV